MTTDKKFALIVGVSFLVMVFLFMVNGGYL